VVQRELDNLLLENDSAQLAQRHLEAEALSLKRELEKKKRECGHVRGEYDHLQALYEALFQEKELSDQGSARGSQPQQTKVTTGSDSAMQMQTMQHIMDTLEQQNSILKVAYMELLACVGPEGHVGPPLPFADQMGHHAFPMPPVGARTGAFSPGSSHAGLPIGWTMEDPHFQHLQELQDSILFSKQKLQDQRDQLRISSLSPSNYPPEEGQLSKYSPPQLPNSRSEANLKHRSNLRNSDHQAIKRMSHLLLAWRERRIVRGLQWWHARVHRDLLAGRKDEEARTLIKELLAGWQQDLTPMYLPPPVPAELETSRAFNAIDKNADGVIDREEWMRAFG